jgi:hypothetical protein
MTKGKWIGLAMALGMGAFTATPAHAEAAAAPVNGDIHVCDRPPYGSLGSLYAAVRQSFDGFVPNVDAIVQNVCRAKYGAEPIRQTLLNLKFTPDQIIAADVSDLAAAAIVRSGITAEQLAPLRQ